MVEEQTFRRDADRVLEQLKQSLIDAEEDGGFEVEENSGVLNVVFDSPGTKFVFTPNTPVRQIWISALTSSFKLDWIDGVFILPKSGEDLKTLTARLLREQTGNDDITLQ
ncbi:MAG: iron donor protein CyaY [Janthinobacterium lividum]